MFPVFIKAPEEFLSMPRKPTKTWTYWEQLFKNYFIASGQIDCDEKTKIGLLLHSICLKGQRIFSTNISTEITYANVLETISRCFEERIRF